jgi:hypothetical protein
MEHYQQSQFAFLNDLNSLPAIEPRDACTYPKHPILFRKVVPEIPSTTYGAFAFYNYPAKFIPQVIAYVLREYACSGMTVFDPFAGYGTVGTVARIYGYNYELWDLNPLITTIHRTVLLRQPEASIRDNLLRAIKTSKETFIPRWSNLSYWFPDEFLPLLYQAWGLTHALDEEKKHLLAIPLLKTTRYFSYSDENVHKLYKSKHSKSKISKLLNNEWQAKFYTMLGKEVDRLLRKIWEYNQLQPQAVNGIIKAGIDTLTASLDHEVDILITSPPYLQAQEYIRSTKLELFWLGYEEDYIRQLSKKEIPYRAVSQTTIFSETYHVIRERITEDHLKVLYDRYFHAILHVLATLSNYVSTYMCIFVGPAKIRTTSIPIDNIIVEHMNAHGWQHEVTLVDTIVSRAMFESPINPASGLEDSRMKTEHMIILRRP